MSLIISDVEHLFMYQLATVCLLWRNVYLGLLPIFLTALFVSLLLSYIICLYILEIKPLLLASFANIFSQSVDDLFILLMVFFAV